MRSAEDGARRKPNHLAGQTSPYLLQHAYNPVDWYPWDREALDRAREESKPIFLSIGYAACHWCHVMERESFEDDDVAAFLNEHFVSIKVDREERPDIDDVYMNAVQVMTGSGGWPLNVFLTPDLKPFFGGTYFPPASGYGRPGFLDLLHRIREVWNAQRGDVEASAEKLAGQLRRLASSIPVGSDEAPVGRTEIARAVADLTARFDARWGGFSPAPKFPPHGAIGLLLREHARSGESVPRSMAALTLDRMALGGMYDHIGGGFARYSTDEHWLVPHFEKMLYDQALLVPAYLDGWLVTRSGLYRRVVEETLDFVRREMTGEEGGFFASIDADSAGHEGLFYTWTPEEIDAELGPDEGALFRRVYGITAGGNFEGRSIPNLLEGSLSEQAEHLGIAEEQLVSRLNASKARLVDARSRRERPATDNKILTAWNGLMIGAFARAYQVFGREEDLHSATRAAEFVLTELCPGGEPKVSFRGVRSQVEGFLDDHAFLSRGLLDLFEACFEPRYLHASLKLAGRMVDVFEDKEHGGFFFTGRNHEALITRNRSSYDGALPSGAGIAAEVLVRLSIHFDRGELREVALRTLRAARREAERIPSAFASMCAAAALLEDQVVEIAIVGRREDPGTAALLASARNRFQPNRVIAWADPRSLPSSLALLAGKAPVGDRPTAYVCRNYACRAPVHDPESLIRELEQLDS